MLALVAAALIAAAVVGIVPPAAPAAASVATDVTKGGIAAPSPVSGRSRCTAAWPYYEQSCLQQGRADARPVRLIQASKAAANQSLNARR
jgi:hypothetical protein